ncbi:hypothetical protein [Streptomyces sp. SP18CS02]|uniref:hypothetical protein n=1 Tax=Streptomyces sp. SP18CS02 TaxID=3002531 RepID=UPI002E771B01|nr:hypothetical protein [Streptomyces sp. SP18CS02]MEE1753138.1 hypothetical protein [Streptomyces sp. SP18CS02]
MFDWIELWLRKTGGLWVMGAGMVVYAFARDWWMPLRAVVLVTGVMVLVGGAMETGKLIRRRRSATAELDRLESEQHNSVS